MVSLRFWKEWADGVLKERAIIIANNSGEDVQGKCSRIKDKGWFAICQQVGTNGFQLDTDLPYFFKLLKYIYNCNVSQMWSITHSYGN